MIVAVSGATGLIGAALVERLGAGGHRVLRLSRSGDRTPDVVRWDPEAGTVDAAGLAGVDAVVHLAGEPVAGGRWTEARKRRILDSRVRGTGAVARALAGLDRPPRVLVSASAIGIYGDRGDTVLPETSAPGTGFLAGVCREWEAATAAATERGVRVVHARIGLVLSVRGGALAALLRPFRLGLGGVVGSGTQWMSWIAIDDAVGALLHAVATEALAGPVNVVAPAPVTNAEFTRTLARVLGRPAMLPLPAFAARLAFGEMADELLLASARVEPARLGASGYAFRHGTLEEALRSVLEPAR